MHHACLPQAPQIAEPREAELEQDTLVSIARAHSGPLPELAGRLWHADLAQPVTLLEVFCGDDRAGDMRDATIMAGGSALGIDVTLGGRAHDVLDDVVFDAIATFVTAKLARHLWLGIVCSSLSQLWLKAGRPRLRSRQQPDGIQPMPRQWQQYIARANLLIERGCALAMMQYLAGGTYYIENPADVGFMRSPFFKE